MSSDLPPAGAIPGPPETIQLGKYAIHELLGTGGMAEIYRASVRGPQGFAKPVVIKRVKPKFTGERVFVEMFIDEARINAALDHPNIVSVFDFGEKDGNYFIAMEYIDGIDLQTAHVRHKERYGVPLPWEVSLVVVRDVLRALDFAHRAVGPDGRPLGIIHRDVNLVNVMIRRDGMVKLLDFGCAKASSAIRTTSTLAGVIKGKIGYMSPEQTEDEVLDARTDVFSAATVLHELLTGRRLFYAENEVQMLRAVQEKPIPDPRKYRPELPDSVVHLCAQGLARDRNERFDSAGAMADALESILLEQRISPSRVRQMMDELMVADATPEQRLLTDQMKKVTVVTWLSLPVQEMDSGPRLVSGAIDSVEAPAPGSDPNLEQSPLITTHHRWTLGNARTESALPAASEPSEAVAPVASAPPAGPAPPADALRPVGRWATDGREESEVTQPMRVLRDDQGISGASKVLLVIIFLFVATAVALGLWAFSS